MLLIGIQPNMAHACRVCSFDWFKDIFCQAFTYFFYCFPKCSLSSAPALQLFMQMLLLYQNNVNFKKEKKTSVVMTCWYDIEKFYFLEDQESVLMVDVLFLNIAIAHYQENKQLKWIIMCVT